MSTHRIYRQLMCVLGTVMAGAVATTTCLPAQARASDIEPANLVRGADPSVAYLVHDTIRDGSRSVPATRLGDHAKLWSVKGGYVLQDWLQRAQVFRLVFVTGTGERRVIGRSPGQVSVAVSPSGTRMAWAQGRNELESPTVVKVANPSTGKVLARRSFPWASVSAVSSSRVLLTLRGVHLPVATSWWDFERNTLTKVTGQAALRADLRHDRVVLATGPADSFCNRVVALSNPEQTLWRSCRRAPHSWSPNGQQVAATHTYLDDAGTNLWEAVSDRNARRLGRVTGRFDWEAVWEDNGHFLTLALGNSGNAAVIRCTTGGRCERASRLWYVGKVTYQPNYVAPPVVLASS